MFAGFGTPGVKSKTKKIMKKMSGEIVKVNDQPSAKLGLFSVIVAFTNKVKTAVGEFVLREDYVGIAFTEEQLDLEVGTKVHCEVGDIRTSTIVDENTGETVIRKSAPCVITGLIEVERPEVVKTAKGAKARA